MKRHILITALGASLLLGAAVQAQTAEVSSTTSAPSATPGAWEGHKHQGGGVLEHLTNALSLSGSQQTAVAAILDQAKPQLKAIRDNALAQRKTVIDNAASQISPLLTPDQQTRFNTMVQKFENAPAEGHRFAGRRHPGGPGGPDSGALLQRLSAKLNLTTDQQAQIKPILDAAHQQVLTVRNDSSLTQEQKFAKIKDAIQGARSQVTGILTPAQQQQFAALKGRFHHGQQPPVAQPSATPATTGSAS